ncbi:MAG: hypothetical protein ABR576_16540 [Thermoanaerobaculia bacterium]
MSRAIAGLVAAAALAAGACATGNGSQQSGDIRVAATEQEVAGCERVINVRVLDAPNRDTARVELQRLAKDRGANTLLLPSGGDGNSGTAYRCSAPSTAAN